MPIGGGFSGILSEGEVQTVGSFTLILDSITTRNIVANITSRLVGNISNLISGDTIACAAIDIQDTRILNYVLRGKIKFEPLTILKLYYLVSP